MEGEMEKLWKELPLELLDRVLLFIPIPDLLSFRKVCTEWNHYLICPNFAALYAAQAANIPFIFRTLDTVLTRRDDDDDGDEDSWEIYDVRREKYYNLSDNFLFDQVRDRFTSPYQRITIAADKGLLCMLWAKVSSEDLEKEAIFVCNPVTKSFKEIPASFTTTHAGFQNPSVAMVVADDMRSYRIYVVQESSLTSPDRKRSHVFDSSLGAWREISQPQPCTVTPCSTMLNVVQGQDSKLYTIFCDLATAAPKRLKDYKLYAYDTRHDTWTDTEVQLPSGRLAIPQLVTYSNRVFLVAFEETISIWEIKFWEKECSLVVEMDEDIAEEMKPMEFGSKGEETTEWSIYDKHVGMAANILVVGADNYIVISSIATVSVAYNLSTKLWSPWRENGILSFPDIEDEGVGLIGSCSTLRIVNFWWRRIMLWR